MFVAVLWFIFIFFSSLLGDDHRDKHTCRFWNTQSVAKSDSTVYNMNNKLRITAHVYSPFHNNFWKLRLSDVRYFL